MGRARRKRGPSPSLPCLSASGLESSEGQTSRRCDSRPLGSPRSLMSSLFLERTLRRPMLLSRSPPLTLSLRPFAPPRQLRVCVQPSSHSACTISIQPQRASVAIAHLLTKIALERPTPTTIDTEDS
eukprot:6202376-Pleurochrysis_carterae.AAC.3